MDMRTNDRVPEGVFIFVLLKRTSAKAVVTSWAATASTNP
jgi:hypothetical protein